MRKTLAFLTLALCGGIAFGVACDNNPPSNNTTPDMAMMAQPDLTMVAMAPSVTSLNTVKGTTAGGTAITITGTNFVAGATVTIGGKAATNVMVTSSTTITATTPANLGLPGAVDVVVNNNNGTAAATLAKGFLYFLGTTAFMAPGTNPTIMGLGANGPRNIATLDLTGQGNISMITANGGGNNISVLANATVPPGALTFGATVNITLNQNNTISAAVGDMNADGTLDVVTANAGSNSLSAVIRSGVMATPNTIATAVGAFNGPRYVAIADFDGDKNQDIVVTNSNSTVSIVRGSANGTTYTAAMGSPFSPGFDVYGVAVADFDGDMRPDVAVGNVAAASTTIRVLLNKSAGWMMQAATTITGSSQPNALVAGDFDGDKKIDLAVANRGNGTVAILKGDGAGAFTLNGALITVGTGPEAITAADLNLDGFLDLVVPNLGSNNLHVITGKGDGTFNMPTMVMLVAGSQPNAVAVADFNRDGRPDIAVTRYATGGVDVLLGTGM